MFSSIFWLLLAATRDYHDNDDEFDSRMEFSASTVEGDFDE